MDDHPTDSVVAVIPRDGRTEFRVSHRTFEGRRYVDLRLYVENSRREMVSTKTGIRLRIGYLPTIIAALRQAEAEARAEGAFDD